MPSFESFKQENLPEKSPEIEKEQLPKLSIITNKVAEKLKKKGKGGRTLSDIVYETCLDYGVLYANVGESIENLVQKYIGKVSKELRNRALIVKFFSGEKNVEPPPITTNKKTSPKKQKIDEPTLF